MTVAEHILSLLGSVEDNRVLSAGELIKATGRASGTVYTILKRLVAEGAIVRARYGMYHLPGVVPPSSLSSAPNGPHRRIQQLEERVAALEAKLA